MRLLTGMVTGLLTGLIVASGEELFYLVDIQPGIESLNKDTRVFDGIEALITFLVLPIVAGWLVTLGFRDRKLFPRLVGVAYLTVAIPLIGIGIGGANIPQQMLAGAIGGTCWGLALLSRPLRPR